MLNISKEQKPIEKIDKLKQKEQFKQNQKT